MMLDSLRACRGKYDNYTKNIIFEANVEANVEHCARLSSNVLQQNNESNYNIVN